MPYLTDTLMLWLYGCSVVLMVIVVIWQASEAYQARKIRKLIDYASTEFAAKLAGTLILNQQGDLGSWRHTEKIPVTVMEEKLENLGQKMQGKDMFGKPLRDKNGKFVGKK